nr:MAG: hypothetical protein [Bacteriophage sp.]
MDVKESILLKGEEKNVEIKMEQANASV